MVFEGSMSFTILKIAAFICFSRDQSHLRPRKLPRALVFRRLNAIYGTENGRRNFIFEGSMPFNGRKIAAHTCFRRLDAIYGAKNCCGNFVFEGSMSFTILKIAALTCFSRARCHLRPRKLLRTLVFQRLDTIYGEENCHARLFFEDPTPFTFRKIA